MISLSNKNHFHLCFSLLLVIFFTISAEVTYRMETRDYSYADCDFNSNGTISGCNGTVTEAMDIPILENEYIKVELLPRWGARIRSFVYKPSGNEETNPSSSWGQPMFMDAFFYNFLWVNGGFYPTIGPEHGKYFHLPWEWEVVKENEDTVAVAMYMTDSIPWRQGCSGKFSGYYATGIEVEFVVKVITGKTSCEVEVTVTNPSDDSHTYEYWTNTSMFPGGGNSEGYEMVAPVDIVQIDYWCTPLMGAEVSAGGDSFYYFDNLRFIRNWPDQGILYAHNYPFNFWGVIDHNEPVEEGIIRICDNIHTFGLKIWGNPPSLFEPWAGTQNRFFSPATIQPREVKNWKEWFTPTAGLSYITHSSEHMLINLLTDKEAYDGNSDDNVNVTCQFFSIMPGTPVHAMMRFEGGGAWHVIYDNDETPDPVNGNSIQVSVPCSEVYNGVDKLVAVFTDANGKELLSAIKTLSFENCATAVSPAYNSLKLVKNGSQKFGAVYTLSGRLVKEIKNIHEYKNMKIPNGVYILMRHNRPAERFLVTKY